jgi:hypothetical protein
MHRTWKQVPLDEREPVVLTATELDMMNATEIIGLLNRAGVRAHRGVPLSLLRGMIKATCKGEHVEIKNKVDDTRDLMNKVLEGYTRRSQIPPSCPANCYLHPDLMALHCARVNAPNINALRKTDGQSDH